MRTPRHPLSPAFFLLSPVSPLASLVCAAAVLLLAGAAAAQLPAPPDPLMPRGLVKNEPGTTEGYVLFSPILSYDVYLIDNQGRVVHKWTNEYSGGSHYLLPNGHLLRGARDPNLLDIRAGGVGGILQEIDWDGKVLWEYRLSSADRVLHHDIEPLPGGHLLAIAWERKTPEEAIAKGRRPDATPEQGLLSEWLLEIEPQRPDGAKIVWQWHVWDHLVQDHDPKAPDYAEPRTRPGRLDVNAGAGAPRVSQEELEQLQALGYVPDAAKLEDLRADFLHMNAVDYHPRLDQIALSIPFLGEVWILDHSTSTEEAAGSEGGRADRGGDLLYRWGNPSAYGRGEPSSRRLFAQHDVRWIPEGWKDAGHLTVFNNGLRRPAGNFSSVDQIEPPLTVDGRYALAPGAAFGPPELAKSLRLPPDRFAPFISGAERLQNGNTFVCAGTDGILLELGPTGEILWEYRNPYSGNVRLADGTLPGPGIDKLPFAVFRATRIPADHLAVAGRKLEPISPQPKPHVLAPGS